MAADNVVHQLPPRLRSFSPTRWHGKTPPARDWMIQDLALRKTVCLFNGPGSAGKSLLMLQLLTAAAVGGEWLGHGVPHVKSFGLFGEDPEDEIHRRMEKVAGYYGTTLGDLDDIEMVSSDVISDVALYRGNPKGGVGSFTPLWRSIRELCRDEGRQLIVIDNVMMVFQGNQNAPDQVTHFMSGLKELAAEVNGLVMLIQHPSADGMATKSGESGARAWSNAARSRLFLTFPDELDQLEGEESNERIHHTRKNNYGAPKKGLRVEWRDGVFVPLTIGAGGQLASWEFGELAGKIVAAIREMAAMGQEVSLTFGSPRHIATVLGKKPEWRRYTWQHIDEAASWLVKNRRLRVDETGSPSKRRAVLRVAERQEKEGRDATE